MPLVIEKITSIKLAVTFNLPKQTGCSPHTHVRTKTLLFGHVSFHTRINNIIISRQVQFTVIVMM